MEAAVANNAVLLTKDKDFGEIVIRQTIPCKGVVLIRIDDLSNVRRVEQVVDLLLRYAHHLAGHFTVIQEDKIRIRKLE